MSRPRSPPLALALALMLAAAGCFHHRLDVNAPGHVSLEPPVDLSQREPDTPLDPGDQALIVRGGPSVAGGAALYEWGTAAAIAALSLDLSALYGVYSGSALSPWRWPFPDRALGAGLGLAFQGTSPNPVLHAELQGQLLWGQVFASGLGLGWAWEPTHPSARGPQITVTAGPLFFRASYLRERGVTFLLGITVQPAFFLIWSR